MTVNAGKEFSDEQLDKVSGGFDKKTVVVYRFDAGDTFEDDGLNLLVVTKDTDDRIWNYADVIVQEYRANSGVYVKGRVYPIRADKLANMRFRGNGYTFTIVE